MRAELKGLSSIDLPQGPPELPEDPEDCWIPVEAMIGITGEPESDQFLFYVCTPKRLSQVLERNSYQLGRHLIIVKRFDWNVIEEGIKQLLVELHGERWEDLATKLGQHGLWEFEDYTVS